MENSIKHTSNRCDMTGVLVHLFIAMYLIISVDKFKLDYLL